MNLSLNLISQTSLSLLHRRIWFESKLNAATFCRHGSCKTFDLKFDAPTIEFLARLNQVIEKPGRFSSDEITYIVDQLTQAIPIAKGNF